MPPTCSTSNSGRACRRLQRDADRSGRIRARAIGSTTPYSVPKCAPPSTGWPGRAGPTRCGRSPRCARSHLYWKYFGNTLLARNAGLRDRSPAAQPGGGATRLDRRRCGSRRPQLGGRQRSCADLDRTRQPGRSARPRPVIASRPWLSRPRGSAVRNGAAAAGARRSQPARRRAAAPPPRPCRASVCSLPPCDRARPRSRRGCSKIFSASLPWLSTNSAAASSVTPGRAGLAARFPGRVSSVSAPSCKLIVIVIDDDACPKRCMSAPAPPHGCAAASAWLNVDRRERRRPRIMSAAFSAIMITGALMLPPTRSGITEASTTRRPSTPRTRSCGSTTAISSLSRAHLAGAERVVQR